MNKRIAVIGNSLLFLLTLPSGVIYGWLVVIFSMIFYMAHKPKFTYYGVLTAQWRPWFAERWNYSTTFGKGIIYHPSSLTSMGIVDRRIEQHELVHVRQAEDRTVLALIIGLIVFAVTGNWILGLILWMSGTAWQLPNFLTAVLRGGHIYRDTEHERSAYAQTDVRDGVKSWLDYHLFKKRTW